MLEPRFRSRLSLSQMGFGTVQVAHLVNFDSQDYPEDSWVDAPAIEVAEAISPVEVMIAAWHRPFCSSYLCRAEISYYPTLVAAPNYCGRLLDSPLDHALKIVEIAGLSQH